MQQMVKWLGEQQRSAVKKVCWLIGKDFKRLGGTWKLTNEKSEKIGDQIWQKGVSVITDKEGKEHKVNFTLIFIQENGQWKILQDAYW